MFIYFFFILFNYFSRVITTFKSFQYILCHGTYRQKRWIQIIAHSMRYFMRRTKANGFWLALMKDISFFTIKCSNFGLNIFLIFVFFFKPIPFNCSAQIRLSSFCWSLSVSNWDQSLRRESNSSRHYVGRPRHACCLGPSTRWFLSISHSASSEN